MEGKMLSGQLGINTTHEMQKRKNRKGCKNHFLFCFVVLNNTTKN